MTDNMNKSAKEMFEELGFEYREECYEHPIGYIKKRKTKNIFDIDDSFSFYKSEKIVTIWKDNKCVLLTFKEINAMYSQLKELGWLDD